ncbi:hypothetical protein DM02DRAFT_395384 [Periconia macrospinosa]|uniref:Uncharacterized protein n=1 Tax=Periconia macrospinosa TaxID=97972 RepID=A0A2V1DT65_9PLEO|nr:hypothetical protein DM02DRAFT_395384 [Periconia macrospinosa]
MAAERAATTATAINEQRTLEYYQSTVDDDAYTLEAKKQEERAQREKAKLEKNLAKTHGEWYPSQPYRASKPSNLSYYTRQGMCVVLLGEVKKGQEAKAKRLAAHMELCV